MCLMGRETWVEAGMDGAGGRRNPPAVLGKVATCGGSPGISGMEVLGHLHQDRVTI